MWNHISQSRICQFRQSRWNALSHNSFSTTFEHTNYCLICSQRIVPSTRQTAVLKVLSDILSAANTGSLSMLTLLDLTAAFDTVDHLILLRRLQTWAMAALFLHGSRPTSPTEHIMSTVANPPRPACQSCSGCHRVQSSGRSCFCCIQRTWCGWLSFGLQPHLYADNTQIYGSCRPCATDHL